MNLHTSPVTVDIVDLELCAILAAGADPSLVATTGTGGAEADIRVPRRTRSQLAARADANPAVWRKLSAERIYELLIDTHGEMWATEARHYATTLAHQRCARLRHEVFPARRWYRSSDSVAEVLSAQFPTVAQFASSEPAPHPRHDAGLIWERLGGGAPPPSM